MDEIGKVSGLVFAPLRCGHAKAVQNVDQTNLLPLNENCELPVVFTVYIHHTARSHLK